MLSLQRLLAIATVALILAGSANAALTISQLEPNPSLAEANWAITDQGGYYDVDLTKVFKDASMVNTSSPLVLQFNVSSEDAGKPILIKHFPVSTDVGEEVTNNTGLVWDSYLFQLVNFAGMPMDVDAWFGSSPTSDVFGSVSQSTDSLHFTNGTVGDGELVHFLNIEINYTAVDGGAFYLKEIATPEPATIGLLAAAGAGLLARRRRRR